MNEEVQTEGAVRRAGRIALVGRPNAGKSTLMNRLLGEKVAIVSDKPQTTRHRLVGILSGERGQMVFVDTPGVHQAQHRMNRRMVKVARESLDEAEVVTLIVDASVGHGGGDRFMMEWVRQTETPVVVLLNKSDRVAKKDELLPRIALYADAGFEHVIPTSARSGDGCDRVEDLLWGLLPEGEPLYDPELVTIHPERFLVGERIREKVLEQTRDELPFATAVVVDDWNERDDGLVEIRASLMAERESQRGILVGKGGRQIKAIGTAARHDLEQYLERRVFLDLRVRVEPHWRENRRVLEDLEKAPYDVRL